jgi:hypothetical protein
MSERECAFEPGFASCAECGRSTDELGTCKDFALCYHCKRELVENMGDDEANRIYRSYILTSVDGHDHKPPHRVLHYDNGSGPVCHPRGGPHPVTVNRNETNCKKCVRVLTEKE